PLSPPLGRGTLAGFPSSPPGKGHPRRVPPFLLSERNVVVAAVLLVGREARRGRHRGPTAGAPRPLGPAHELDALGHHLGGAALLAVPALPVARLQAALDEDLAALVDVLPARLGLLAPHHHREEARLLALLPALGRVV